MRSAELSDRYSMIESATKARHPRQDPELRAQLATGSALLTRLDSEWFVA